MTARQPIDPADIKPGDLIRWESAFPETATLATEFRAGSSGKGYRAAGTYYLLDRPAPAVDLPMEPTLGWANGRIGIWQPGGEDDYLWDCHQDANGVTAFTPATAVPTSALEKLRGHLEFWRRNSTAGSLASEVAEFLNAAVAANGAAS